MDRALPTNHGLIVSSTDLALAHELAEGILLHVGSAIEAANVGLDDAANRAADIRLETAASTADSSQVLRVELADSRAEASSEALARPIRSSDRIGLLLD